MRFVLLSTLFLAALVPAVLHTLAGPLSAQPEPTAAQGASVPRITAYTLAPELARKAHTLYQIRFSLRLIRLIYSPLVLWWILRRRWAVRFRDWAERMSRYRVLQAFIFAPLLILTVGLLELPLGLAGAIVLKRYGILVQTWGSWIGDWAKGEGLLMLVGGFLCWLLYAVIRSSPQRWWFYFWIASLPIFLFLVFISPYVIDPLFNKYELLASKAPQLISGLQQVTRRAGQEVPPERMFWMKASDKTIGTNASVNGFGASKRIIIWDTTIAQETTDEVIADFGHEMGHYALNHIRKGFFFFASLMFVLLYAGYRGIHWLLARSGEGWGIRSVDDWASLPALLLVLTVFGVPSQLAANAFSRYVENQADIYGLEVTHGILPDPGQAAARSFQKYGETVFVEPNPNPLDVFLFFDHPPVRDRIQLCVTYDPWSKGEQPQFVK